MRRRGALFILCLIVATITVLWVEPAESSPINQTSPLGIYIPPLPPPTHITLEMHKLFDNGGLTTATCSANDKNWGCSTYCADRANCKPLSDGPGYPWPTKNISIPIEADSQGVYYLRDVLAIEMPPDQFEIAALRAQAIAARTYAYWKVAVDPVEPGPIDNSNNNHVFVPFRYNIFDSANRSLIDAALQDHYYISNIENYTVDMYATQIELSNVHAIFSEYKQDSYLYTVDHSNSTFPYLSSVQDPISSHSEIQSVGQIAGMSQRGAGRWAHQNKAYDKGKDKGKWSVRWTQAEEILTHYYTGVQIRDSSNSNAVVTPNTRWVPLEIDWKTVDNQPPQLNHGSSYQIRVRVQNTGTNHWNCTYPFFNFQLRYQWRRAGQVYTPSNTSQTLCSLAKGDEQWVDITLQDIPSWGSSAYVLRLDMATSNATGATCSDIQAAASTNELWFGDDCGWYPYDINFCVDGLCRMHLPQVVK